MKVVLDKYQKHFLEGIIDLNFLLKPVGKKVRTEFGLPNIWDQFEKVNGPTMEKGVFVEEA